MSVLASPVSDGHASVPTLCGLRRDRLIAALNRVPAARLGMVLAPAGSGKTTLLADWSRTAPGAVAWCRATRDDTAASLLARIAERWGLPADPDEGPRALLRHLHATSTTRLLVLDDLHVLADTAARGALDELVRDAPASMSVLLGSRVRPDLDLVHSEVCIAPVLLRQEDLRFRSWEVESLFRDVYRTPLSPDEAAALARHTGGWAAALHLFHLSASGLSAAGRHRAISALAGRNRYARGYLSQQVLLGLGPARSDFMRRTSVFEVLTARRCDELLERTDSQAILEELVARHALTTTEDGGATFRYHEVLRRHLEADLEVELGSGQLRLWCARAAELLEGDGAPVEALRVRARARDWPGVRQLLMRSGVELTGHAGSWTGLVPDTVLRDDPWVGLAQACRLLTDGQLARAAATARAAQAGLDDPRADERIRELLAITRAWEHLECPPTRRWHEQVAQALRQLRAPGGSSAAARVPHEDVLARPFLALLRGDLGEVRTAVLIASGRVDPHSPTALALGLLDALRALLEGQDAAREMAEAVAAQAELDDLGWFIRASRALLAATDPDVAAAADDVERVIASCEARGDAWGAAWAATVWALSGLDRSETWPRLDQARDRLDLLGAAVPVAWLLALSAHQRCADDTADAALRARAAARRAHDVGCPGAQAVARAALVRAQHDASGVRTSTVPRESGVPPWVRWSAGEPVPTAAAGHALEVSVTLLGRFEIAVAGRPLGQAGLRPQARQVLRLLALDAGVGLHRERLAGLLWPDESGGAEMHRLQVAVSSLRRWLDELAPRAAGLQVLREGELYRLTLPPGADVDLRRIRSTLQRARAARRAGESDREREALAEALELYAGDLLPEDLTDRTARQREHLRTEVAQAAAALAALLAGQGDPRGAVVAAERSVSLDPYNDAAWQTLIEVYGQLGEVAREHRARRWYADVLRELGVPPQGGRH